ncbi:MAG: LamG-like jellyroll fold domain-containing protein, partial [Halanaerobiales bacterium]
ILIEKNQIYNCHVSSGVRMCGENIVIKDNIINKVGRTGIYLANSLQSQIINNTVSNVLGVHGNGISTYRANSDILIADNRVFKSTRDFTFEGESSLPDLYNNIILYNNLFFDGSSHSWGNIKGATILNNIFAGGLSISESDQDIIIKNNIINGLGLYVKDDIECSHNLYTALNHRQDSRYGWFLSEGEIIEENLDKVYYNIYEDDFHHTAISPGINAGIDVTEYLPISLFYDYDFYKDIDGNPRINESIWDIGPYEFQGVDHPVAHILYDTVTGWITGYEPFRVFFNGSNSFSLDGNIVGYEWDFGDGSTATGVTARHTFLSGEYTVELTVIDDQGNKDTMERKFTIYEAEFPNLYLYLPFDSDCKDYSGKNMIVNSSQSVIFENALDGRAIRFNNENSRSISVEHSNYLDGLEELTIAFLAKRDLNDGEATVIHKHGVYSIEIDKDGFSGCFFNDDGQRNNFTSGNFMNDTEWHHYALTYDGSTLVTYIDGLEHSLYNFSGSIKRDASREIIIGRDPWGNSFEGLMDDIRIYDRSLSESEIMKLAAEKLSLGFAPVINQQPEDRTISMGGTVSFSVEASAYPEPDYQWYHDNEPLQNGENTHGEKTNTLTIDNIQSDDAGEYTVVISNIHGAVTAESANLDVIGPLPLIVNLNAVAEYNSIYLSWENPTEAPEEWDGVLIFRLNDNYLPASEVITPDNGEEVYSGQGTTFIDSNLDDGDYKYAVFTYKECETNKVYSTAVSTEIIKIPEEYNKNIVRMDACKKDCFIIGQNTRGDFYSLWNEEKISIGRGPTGNETSLWLYSDIIGNDENQISVGSEIVSARLVFTVAGSSFLSGTFNENISDENITNENITNGDITDINLPHIIKVYQITDPDNLGSPHFADESGLRVGLDFNYRDHRPGINIPWMNHEEDSTQSTLDNLDDILNIFKGVEPVDILEFYPEVFRDEIVDTIQFDITEAVQAWVEGEINHGLFITAGQGWNNGEELSLLGITVDDEGQSVRPYLEIIYGDSVDDLKGPEAVSGLEITPGENSLELNWVNPNRSITPNQDMVGVKIIRRERIVPFNSQDDTVVTILECNDDINNSYIDTGLEIGKTYYYSVYTFDEEHNYSEKVWIKGTPNSPDAPTFNGNPVIDSGSVTINWNTVAEADGYRIYRKGNSGDLDPEENSGNMNHEYISGKLKCIEISDGSAVSYEDYLSLGTYTYWMTAVNEYGEGPVSEVISVEINDNNLAADKPVEPTLFSGEAISSNEVRLSWIDNSTNESGFVIERLNESNEYEEISCTVYNTTEYIDRGLRPGTLYQYRIKAVNSAGESDYAECEVRTDGIANITWEVISATHVKLRWEDRSDESGYTVKLMDLDGDVLDTQYLLSDTYSCILGGLEPGGEYRAEISADIDSNVEEECVSVSDIIRTSADSKGGLF